MTSTVNSRDIPEGHGLSFKKGLADGLLNTADHAHTVPHGHEHSYARGKSEGEALCKEIAARVKR